MKTNYRALKLVEMGLSAKVVSRLNESQLNTLYSKLLTEQVKEVPQKKTFEIGPQGGKVGNITITQDPVTKKVMATTENELSEEDSPLEKDAEQSYTGQLGPHDASDEAPDGMDDDSDNDRKWVGMSESRKKRKKTEDNPWAICTSQLGKEFGTRERSEWSKKQSNKYERCVKDVKKSLKEGKEPLSLFLENEIMNIVEKHLAPKITKGDLIKYLHEASSPSVAPSKPTTKPDTKPRTKPGHPGKKPFEGPNPSPKAKKKETQESSSPAVAPSKPTTKPTTKPNTRPSHPGKKPFEGPNPSPKAISPEEAKNTVIDTIMNILKK